MALKDISMRVHAVVSVRMQSTRDVCMDSITMHAHADLNFVSKKQCASKDFLGININASVSQKMEMVMFAPRTKLWSLRKFSQKKFLS